MATALTVYLQSASASTTISTANKLLENASTGGTLTNKNSNLTSGTTGWIEMWSQGNASAQTGAGSEPAPDARGWLDDGTTLEGNQFASGTWTATIQLETTVAGTFTADIHVRAYQRSSGGTYTLIAEMTSTGQSVVNTAFTTYTVSATSVAASNTFATGDKLYIDILLNITTNATTGNMRLEESSSATLGNVNAQIVTPGYQSIIVNTMSFTDSLTATDSTLATDVDQASTPQPLTTYLTSANSSRFGSAELLVSVSGAGSSTSGASTIGSVIGWGELGLGGATTFGATDIGNPSGLGAFLDSKILEGNQIVAGNYSGTLTLSISESGKAVNGAMVLRFWKYNTGTTTYTAIGSITLTAQTINSTSATAFNFPATALPSMTFATNESLYVDAWLDITSNTMDASGALNIFFANSTTQGYSGALFATPGYIVSSDVVAVSDIGGLQAWGIDALTANDSTLATDATVISDTLSTADSALYVTSDIPVEALTVSDVNLATDKASASDSLSIADSSLYTDALIPLEALNVSDVILSQLASSFTDAQSISDNLTQFDGYTTLEALNVSDVTNATDSAGLVDAGSASDIGNLQAWNVDALAVSDALLESDTYQVSDVQSVVDALLGIDSSLYSDLLPLTDSGTMTESPTGPTNTEYDFTDSLSSIDLAAFGGSLLVSDSSATSDSMALAMQFSALDVQVVADLLAQSTSYLVIDAQSIADIAIQAAQFPATDALTIADLFAQSLQFMAMDAQSVADLFVPSTIYLVIDAQTIADFLAQSGTYQVSDAQSVNDLVALISQYMTSEAQAISDSVAYLYIFPATEANSISDALLSSDAIAWLDQAAISDNSVSSFGLVSSDTLSISDQNSVVIIAIPVEALTGVDQLVASRVILNWIDSLAVSDLFAYASTFPLEQTSAIVVAIGRNGNVIAVGRSGTAAALGRSGTSSAAQGR